MDPLFLYLYCENDPKLHRPVLRVSKEVIINNLRTTPFRDGIGNSYVSYFWVRTGVPKVSDHLLSLLLTHYFCLPSPYIFHDFLRLRRLPIRSDAHSLFWYPLHSDAPQDYLTLPDRSTLFLLCPTVPCPPLSVFTWFSYHGICLFRGNVHQSFPILSHGHPSIILLHDPFRLPFNDFLGRALPSSTV